MRRKSQRKCAQNCRVYSWLGNGARYVNAAFGIFRGPFKAVRVYDGKFRASRQRTLYNSRAFAENLREVEFIRAFLSAGFVEIVYGKPVERHLRRLAENHLGGVVYVKPGDIRGIFERYIASRSY